MNLITAIILTKNEELHIQRCIDSLKKVCCKIYVIDSYSTDSTCKIATDCGAVVIQNTYVNQAQQFQWALDNCQIESDWVMRLDADEYLTEQLIQELQAKLSQIPSEVKGVYLPRKVKFLGHVLRFGNLKPVRLLRLWRNGCAYMEQRWMDEHIVLYEGETMSFQNCFIDDNLNGLTEWTQKHNNYSNREIITQLDKRYGLFDKGEDVSLKNRNQQKSWYYRLPAFLRALAYFTLRYVFFLGFLDGIRGLIWLTLQAYWYRFLVDSKLYEMKTRLGHNPTREQVVEYIRRYFNINID